eukprot:TRINITY_DN3152_c0_g1_i22.p1 TRINITY_DN3152_c0_g1~~TRINITY_DN3152_c0_g1_i22.p1  ORF type:complete len:138 (-),score=29.64 TRINITY_DN3152_c0_g1_i22:150-563(-)
MEAVDPAAVDNDGVTALHLAAQNGHEAVVAQLSSMEAVDPAAVSNDGNWTALHLAAQNGHEAVVAQLSSMDCIMQLKQSIRPRCPMMAGPRCIWRLRMNGHEAVVAQLSSMEAVDVAAVDKDGWTCLLYTSPSPRDS